MVFELYAIRLVELDHNLSHSRARRVHVDLAHPQRADPTRAQQLRPWTDAPRDGGGICARYSDLRPSGGPVYIETRDSLEHDRALSIFGPAAARLRCYFV